LDARQRQYGNTHDALLGSDVGTAPLAEAVHYDIIRHRLDTPQRQQVSFSADPAQLPASAACAAGQAALAGIGVTLAEFAYVNCLRRGQDRRRMLAFVDQ
jgi:hypothetical protein